MQPPEKIYPPLFREPPSQSWGPVKPPPPPTFWKFGRRFNPSSSPAERVGAHCDSEKYLGVKIDSKLNWKIYINATGTKLNWANAMLYKVRDFVNPNILKSIYYALSESHINYAFIIWGQNISTINHLYILQKKALRIISFKEHNAHSSPLFHHLKLSKLQIKSRLRTAFL